LVDAQGNIVARIQDKVTYLHSKVLLWSSYIRDLPMMFVLQVWWLSLHESDTVMTRCSYSANGYINLVSSLVIIFGSIDCLIFCRSTVDGKYWVDQQFLMSFVAWRTVLGCHSGRRLSKFSLLPICLRNSLTTQWSWRRFLRWIIPFSMEHNPCQRYVCEKSLHCWSDGWSWI
jgi:hypothetical protein